MTDEERTAAARLMGKSKSEKKITAVTETLNEARKDRWTPAHRAAQAKRMRAYWADKKAEETNHRGQTSEKEGTTDA